MSKSIEELLKENAKLSQENKELKTRIKNYIYENQELKFLTQAKINEINKQKSILQGSDKE